MVRATIFADLKKKEDTWGEGGEGVVHMSYFTSKFVWVCVIHKM